MAHSGDGAGWDGIKWGGMGWDARDSIHEKKLLVLDIQAYGLI